MATCNQAASRRRIFRKPSLNYPNPTLRSTPILKSCPQVKGIVTNVTTMSPNKPNSAISHVAKVGLSNSLSLTASLPGKGYLCTNYSRVLVRGGRANDLPGVGYSAIRGVFDFAPIVSKNNSRSIYGVISPIGFTNFVSSSLRSI